VDSSVGERDNIAKQHRDVDIVGKLVVTAVRHEQSGWVQEHLMSATI
jgi:hypothetical protein